MVASALIAAGLAGLLGGLHCTAMCGGWVALTSMKNPADKNVLLPATTLLAGNIASHAGRMLSYVLVGASLGAIGGAAYAIEWQSVQRALYVGANVMLLALAFSMAHGSRASALKASGWPRIGGSCPRCDRCWRAMGWPRGLCSGWCGA